MKYAFVIAMIFHLANGQALAQEQAPSPFRFSGIYTLSWSGIKIGEASFLANEMPDRLRMESQIRSTGVVGWFASHKSHARVEKASTRSYEVSYSSRNKPRHVKLVFGEDGALKEEIVEPPEDPQRRPPVAAELKAGVLDPLSYVAAVRQALHKARMNKEASFNLRVFDGRRLMDTHYRVAGTGNLSLQGNLRKTVQIIGRRNPVGGFTAKELKKLKSEPPLAIYFSDDEALIPLKLQVNLPLGALSAELTRQCETNAPCQLKADRRG